MTKTILYERLIAGAHAPSGGGVIETRNASLNLSEITARIENAVQRIQASRHPFIGVDAVDPAAFLIGMYACSKAERICVPLSSKDPVRTEFITGTLALDLVLEGDEARRIAQSAPPQSAALAGFAPETMAKAAVLLFTSGTTSNASKGVFMSGAGIDFICQRMNETMALDHSAREYVLAGVDHAFAFGRCHSVLSAGGRIFLPNTLDLRELVVQFGERGCNGLSAVPALLSLLLNQFPNFDASPVRGVGYVQTGAMRFNQESRRKLAAQQGVRSYLHYGLTEAMRAAFLDMSRYPDKLHTEGKPFAGVEMVIKDPDGATLGANQSGEVCIRGMSLALGYTDGERWARNMRDGWYHTGDIGRLDEEGFLIYEGRSADAMNINGNLVYPDDVEDRLRPLFGATPFSVFGMTDPKGVKDDLLYIAYEGEESFITHAQCVRHMKDIGSPVTPDGIIAVRELPRNRTGKVQRFRLSQQLREGN